MYYVDMHIHCAELKDINKYRGEFILVCVSDDVETSNITLKLAEKYEHVKPCVGVHPWIAHKFTAEEIRGFLRGLTDRVQCLGEVGLDKKFKPDTFDKQLEIFRVFADHAREYDMVLNLHAAGAWNEVFNLIYSRDVNKAYFHWYTGPVHLADQITSVGYFIGANPAFMIQEKHRLILDHISLESVITESDSPYHYRGLNLTPELVEKVILYLAEKKQLEYFKVKETVYSNYKKLFK